MEKPTQYSLTWEVTDEMTAKRIGSAGSKILSTPNMVALMEAAALERNSVLPRRSLALSRGTVDQLYLAVRLAVCQLCLPGEDPAPLVLDDALVTFDDRRMALALDALAELGRERQILLFTCQEREGNYLEGRPGVTRTALRGGGA